VVVTGISILFEDGEYEEWWNEVWPWFVAAWIFYGIWRLIREDDPWW